MGSKVALRIVPYDNFNGQFSWNVHSCVDSYLPNSKLGNDRRGKEGGKSWNKSNDQIILKINIHLFQS